MKENRYRLGESGLSMVGVLMAAIILGIVISGIMSALTDVYKVQKRITTKLDTLDLSSRLLSVLSHQSICDANFSGIDYVSGSNLTLPSSKALTVDGLALHSDHSNLLAQENQKIYPSSDLAVDKISIENIINLGGNNYAGSLVVKFKSTNYGSFAPAKTSITFKTNGATIDGCRMTDNIVEATCTSFGGTWSGSTGSCTLPSVSSDVVCTALGGTIISGVCQLANTKPLYTVVFKNAFGNSIGGSGAVYENTPTVQYLQAPGGRHTYIQYQIGTSGVSLSANAITGYNLRLAHKHNIPMCDWVLVGSSYDYNAQSAISYEVKNSSGTIITSGTLTAPGPNPCTCTAAPSPAPTPNIPGCP